MRLKDVTLDILLFQYKVLWKLKKTVGYKSTFEEFCRNCYESNNRLIYRAFYGVMAGLLGFTYALMIYRGVPAVVLAVLFLVAVHVYLSLILEGRLVRHVSNREKDSQ